MPGGLGPTCKDMLGSANHFRDCCCFCCCSGWSTQPYAISEMTSLRRAWTSLPPAGSSRRIVLLMSKTRERCGNGVLLVMVVVEDEEMEAERGEKNKKKEEEEEEQNDEMEVARGSSCLIRTLAEALG